MTKDTHHGGMFDERKAAQSAALFLGKAGGKLSILKLQKLLYLADRLSIDRFGYPITDDRMMSLPHGPVLSATLDLINGNTESAPDGWDYWIKDRENREVALARSVLRDELLDLSDADLEILDETWGTYGKFTPFQLRDFTHTHCAEWKDPHGSSMPITFMEVLRALGKPPDVIEALVSQYKADNAIQRKLSADSSECSRQN
jgi:uncharacterized phage-associated protein